MSIWNNQSAKWKHVGSPTRPSQEDQNIIASIISKKQQNADSTNAVVLGVTPEMIQLRWPEGTTITAVDMNESMIQTLYKPHEIYPTSVKQERWQAISLPDNSTDIVVGDGIFTPLEKEEDLVGLFAEVDRILKPSSMMVVRAFIRPEETEAIDTVVKDALSGKIKNFGSLKWRLAMALTDNKGRVNPAEIHKKFNALFPDRAYLGTSGKWSLDEISTIDAYEKIEGVFTFLTLNELVKISQPYAKIIEKKVGSYELADRCPIIVFEF
jgi:hypothetical protein